MNADALRDTARRSEALLRAALADPRTISFSGGLPASEAFPRAALSEAAQAVLTAQRLPHALQYGWPEGKLGLREWVAHRLRQRGADVGADDVIITVGAQQALSMVVPYVVRSGTRVWVDEASYPNALDLFRTRGAVLTRDLEQADCAYVMPGVTNPHGRDTCTPMLDTLLDAGCAIIADEAYAELRFDGRIPKALIALARNRVFHVGTVSKSLFPGLRIGWIVPPPHLVEELREHKQRRDLQSGALVQSLLMRFLQTHDYEAHLRLVRRLYRARARHMGRALRRTFPEWRFVEPEGGFSFYVSTGRVVCPLEMMGAAARARVMYDPGLPFESEADLRNELTLRLCFAALPTRRIDEGMARLRRAWDEVVDASDDAFEWPRDRKSGVSTRVPYRGAVGR